MSSSRVLLGVTASVVGSLGHSLGMTLQKRAHLRLESIHGHVSTSKTWRDGQWQFGLALYLISSTVPPTIALSMLPVFVAAPLAAVGLVANAVFAKYILNSSFAKTDALGTMLVTLGSCCVAAFGAIDEPLLSLDELLLLYKRPAYVVYFVIYVLAVGFMVGLEFYWRKRYLGLRVGEDSNAGIMYPGSGAVLHSRSAAASRVALHSLSSNNFASYSSNTATCEENAPLLGSATLSPCSDRSFYASTASVSSSTTESILDLPISPSPTSAPAPFSTMYCNTLMQTSLLESLTVSSNEPKRSDTERAARYLSGFLSAIISGLICSQTLLLAKSGIGLLVLTFQGHMQFNDPLALAIVIGLIVTALANLYYIQHALSLSSTLTVVPLCYCSSSLSALVSSLVYFNQVRLLGSPQITMISLGIVLLASGVMLLSSKAEGEDGPLQLPQDSTN